MDVSMLRRTADNIRSLVVAMVEKSKSGHPGGSMGGADFVATLFANHLVYDPRQPRWIARDRFFLDPGHMSPMLYAILAMTGRYTVDELQQLRQWGSITPGHPELDVDRGVENTSGPLGQGHVMAVGAAIAERMLAARLGQTPVCHKTYAYISDGGVQEEISQGAGRLAGFLGLNNLIMFYDANGVQLSTKVDEVTNEDTAAKYRAWGWDVLEIDGNDPAEIDAALTIARGSKHKPVLIIGHTIMAKGAVKAGGGTLEGAVSTHGQPLSKAGGDIDATLRALGADPADPFKIADEVKIEFEKRRQELINISEQRHNDEAAWADENPEEARILKDWIDGKLPDMPWDSIEIKPNSASRNASSKVLEMLAKYVKNMVVSSADLCNSDKTDGFLKGSGAIDTESIGIDFSKGFLQSGVSELTMAAVMNGIALHGGMWAACGTFFVFSDYVKPALRMSALMELPVKYVFSHDSFRVGEDGPTHEPIEHESQIRLMEMIDNLHGRQSTLVLRPADSAETVACWHLAMDNKETPSVLLLSRQDLPDLEETRQKANDGVRHGAYLLCGDKNADITLLGNGSDVSLLKAAATLLAAEGISTRIVSVPSTGLFMRQPREYQQSILPEGGVRFGLTSGLPAPLYPLMRGASKWDIMGLERFGASAPYKVLEEKFGFTPEAVADRIRNLLK